MSFRIGYGQVEPNQLAGQKTGQIYASLPLDNSEDNGVNVLQNGEFMFYDYATGKVTADLTNSKITEPFMVWNEIKLYEDYLALKDFAMIRVGDNYVTNNPAVGRVTSANTNGVIYGENSAKDGDKLSVNIDGKNYPEIKINNHVAYGYRMGGIAPRMMRTFLGDIMTTNMIDDNDGTMTAAEFKNTYKVGTILSLHHTARNTFELCLEAKADTKLKDVIKYVVVQNYTMPDGQPGVKIQRVQ